MTRPLITVGVPVYNGGAHVGQVLDDILEQDFSDFEVIISDNCSTDDTREVCAEYVRRDGRIRYTRNAENIGAIRNFNHLVGLANGTYFCWFADHDRHARNFLSSCLAALEGDPEVVLACPRAAWIESDGAAGDWIPPGLDTRRMNALSRVHVTLWAVDFCYQVYGLMRLAALRQTGVYRPVVGPDLVLLAELAALGSTAHIPETLLWLRRLADFGDWASYMRKLQKPLTPWTAPALFARFVFETGRAGSRAGRTLASRGLYGGLIAAEAAIRHYPIGLGLMQTALRAARPLPAGAKMPKGTGERDG